MKWAVAFIGLIVVVVLAGCVLRAHSGNSGFNAWGAYLTGAGTLILALAALATGILAIGEYKARTAAEQARWIAGLFAQFYQQHQYQFIRQKIDYDDLEDIVPLMQKDLEPDAEFTQEERDLLDRLTDFLNFFEMISHLSTKNQLASDDIKQMFDYYLRRMTRIRRAVELRKYIERTGFENLRRLLLQYSGESTH